MFLAEFLIGKCDESELSNNSKTKLYKSAPLGFDSVKGITGGSDVYIVYANVKTYPKYLVEFSK